MLQETENDFFKARNKALMNEIQHFLKPEESYMISFKEIKKLIKISWIYDIICVAIRKVFRRKNC